jgi:hypothetical protein
MLRMLAFSRWRGRREPGQLWSISLVEYIINLQVTKPNSRPLSERQFFRNCKLVMLRAVRGDHCRTVRPQNHSNSMLFVPIFKCISSWHILSWIHYISIPIIAILVVIQFILLWPDVSIFVATDKHFIISDMALLCEFMH